MAAAALAYSVPKDEILLGAGADEILDLAAKAFLGEGDVAIIPTPSYAMYRVLTEQRAAPSCVPRLDATTTGRSTGRRFASRRPGRASSGCAIRTIRRAASSPRAIEGLLAELGDDAQARRPAGTCRRPRRGVQRVRGQEPARPPRRVSPPRRRAHREQGLRPGRTARRLRDRRARRSARSSRIARPGRSTLSVAIADRDPRVPGVLATTWPGSKASAPGSPPASRTPAGGPSRA